MEQVMLKEDELAAVNSATDLQEQDESQLCRPSYVVGYLACKHGLCTLEDIAMPQFSFMVQKGVLSIDIKKS